jgi:hypothetical protein
MIRSCIRQAVRVFAGAALFSCALGAYAGGITLNDSNCDSFSLSGSPGNQVLTCVVSNAPTGCSIQGASTGTNGVATPLTAICASGSPTSWVWTGGNCANNTTQSCQAIGTNATVTYGVTPSNAIGPGNNATKQVVWSTAVAVKPSQCSIAADVNPLPVGGGTVHLTASCNGGDPVDAWTWSGPTSSSTGNTATASITQASAFGVTATNGGGSGTASLTVNVGSGGGGGTIACSGFLTTNVVTMNWPNWTPNNVAPMGPLDATVLKFTTGATTSRDNRTVGQFTATNSPTANPSTKHDYTLSTASCDFGGNPTTLKSQLNAGTSQLAFTIGQPSSPVNLLPNTTYYVNIRNSDLQGCASNGGSCDVNPLSLYKPPGL